jgi:dUTP pyrophosphatase
MLVKFKRLHPDAVIPKYQTGGSAGADLCSVADLTVYPRQAALVPLGFSVSFHPGFEMQIRPRGSLALRDKVTVLNTPGTVDADYRGEVKVILINHGSHEFKVRKGDRIAQAVFHYVQRAEFVEIEDLDETDRGAGGFGSTGRK